MPSDEDRELEQFEEYLKQKAGKTSQPFDKPAVEQKPDPPKSDFAKTLDYVNKSETGQPNNDPDWIKFKQFLNREAVAEASNNDSGQGDLSHLPHTLDGLNWGACILNVIWGGAMKVPGMALLGWVFLLILPIVQFVFPFYLLFKGNEIAWKHRRWTSHDEFREVQKKWARAGFAIAAVIVLFLILFSVWISSMVGSLLRA